MFKTSFVNLDKFLNNELPLKLSIALLPNLQFYLWALIEIVNNPHIEGRYLDHNNHRNVQDFHDQHGLHRSKYYVQSQYQVLLDCQYG